MTVNPLEAHPIFDIDDLPTNASKQRAMSVEAQQIVIDNHHLKEITATLQSTVVNEQSRRIINSNLLSIISANEATI